MSTLNNGLSHPEYASPFARASLTAYLFLIVYASLYPFTGWQNNSFAAFFKVALTWPRFHPLFDTWINVLGYIPLGCLIVFALYPKIQQLSAILIASLSGLVLSGSMETIQYFIPSRVTSILDVSSNVTGCLTGAIIGVLLIPSILEKGRLHLIRKAWLQRDSSREVLVLSLWPLAQIYPHAYLFGVGQIFPILTLWINQWFGLEFDFSAILLQDIELDAEDYLMSEAIITACGATSAILICLYILNRNAPVLRLSMTLLVSALLSKALAYAILFKPEYAFAWLTPGARGGLLISAIMLYGFSYTPTETKRRLAILLLCIELILTNLVPSNPYFLITLQNLVQGKFLNFYGAAQFLSIAWPFIALWYVLQASDETSKSSADHHQA